MKARKTVIVFMAMVLMVMNVFPSAQAAVVSPGDDFYYLDTADVLSESTEGEIFFCNKLLEEACGAQIVIAAIDTTGNQAIDDYAYEMFNEWGIGDKEKGNGFLLLMAIEDEDYYAMPGEGIDMKFSSGTIGSYLDKYLETDFAKADYDTGAKKFFEAVFERISTIYNADITIDDGIAAYESYVGSNSGSDSVSQAQYADETGHEPVRERRSNLGVILIVLVILYLIFASRRRHRGGNGCLSFLFPFALGRMTSGRSRRSAFTPPPVYHNRHYPPRHNTFGGHGHFGGARPGGGRPGGFGASRPGGFSSGRPGGFGGSRGGGGGTRGGGAGRGRR